MNFEDMTPEEREAHEATHQFVDTVVGEDTYRLEICGSDIFVGKLLENGEVQKVSAIDFVSGQYAIFITPEQEAALREAMAQKLAAMRQLMNQKLAEVEEETQEEIHALCIEEPLDL